MPPTRTSSKRRPFAPYDSTNEASGSTSNMCPSRTRYPSFRLQRLISSVAAGSPVNVASSSYVSESHTPTSQYVDLGDCKHVCEFCGALFWFEERIKASPQYKRPRYNICCRSGAVCLPLPLLPPATLKELFSEPDFLHNIRAYNSMFAMTSFGAEIDEDINSTRGPYVFKVSGQVSHWLGSLCPPPNEKPCYLQMYVYDTDNEIANRMRFFSNSNHSHVLPEVVSVISRTLASSNEYVRLFKSAVDLCATDNVEDFKIKLYNGSRQRTYDPPAPGTLGAIIRDDNPNATNYDIIVHSKGGVPQRVSKLHSSYMPLQYPLLFPYAEQGWSTDLRLRSNTSSDNKKLTMNMYYSYLIHDREGIYTHLLRGGRLFQQFLVDVYAGLEQSRLEYISANQNLFRCEYLSGIHDAISRGDTQGRDVGKRIFLPSSFTGGPRYMYKHYQDALAICRVHGNPQYFITFTCNAKWPEIRRHLDKIGCARAEDRPDIIARVFELKVKSFIKFLRVDKTFGDVTADLYTIEFQKRGLPHCHTLLWVAPPFKIRSPTDVDKYIMAEIPDPSINPTLYKIVSECMLHGPCGLLKSNAQCMRDGKCSKSFPKNFEIATRFDKDGNVHYRRSANGLRVLKNNIPLDNGYVVPYNKTLCMRFDAHINVEYCGWSMMIKYLFKYISKGADRIMFSVSNANDTSPRTSTDTPPMVNEIKNFVDGRYICPHESAWRILNFPIHNRNPSVQLLAVHLEGMQNVTFREHMQLQNVVRNPSFGRTTLTEWLKNNETYVDAPDLRYIDYVSRYWWNDSGKRWIRRVDNKDPAIGRLIYVHPTTGELFYLRLLLCHQKGCRSFAEIRTVSEVTYSTYRAACESLGLIGNDTEWLSTFTEAAIWATSAELRSLFATMLLFCDITNPSIFWQQQWEKMSDDIRLTVNRETLQHSGSINDCDLQQYVLYEIELLLNSSTPSKSLRDFGLPMPSNSILTSFRNRLLMEEKSYDRVALAAQHLKLKSQLNSDQLQVYEKVMVAQNTKSQVLIFVYGHGGTGKTFLWTTIISALRSVGKVVLAVAASGIASLLLPSGRTAHSRFKIPIDLTDQSTCHIKKKTHLSALLTETSLIIWDEAPMSDRRCFESLDRTLRDLLEDREKPFGGKSVLLGGDFRQTLPVIVKASRSEIISSTLPRSYLWRKFKVHRLNHNMRITTNIQNDDHINSIRHFATWLLNVGDGVVGEPDKDDPQNTKIIEIPSQFLLDPKENTLASLTQFVYDESILNNPCAKTFADRAIVCPKNATAEQINDIILESCPGDYKTYLSKDTIIPHSRNRGDIEILYPEEHLNQLNFNGIPPHQLNLKVNTPIILLRNINQSSGLCNGTRLIVSQLLPKNIEAHIITGTRVGQRVYIPKINLTYKNKELPFIFTRRQFPVKPCYAMTINKSQGQSLKRIGVYLPEPVFTHGQLYVALSRSTSPDSLKVLIPTSKDGSINKTKNIVFSDFMDEVNTHEVILEFLKSF